MESLKVKFDVAITKWNGGIGLNFTTAPQDELVEDGRDAEGVSRLTCFEVIQFFEQMSKTSSSGPNEWNDEIINKPTVRQFQSE